MSAVNSAEIEAAAATIARIGGMATSAARAALNDGYLHAYVMFHGDEWIVSFIDSVGDRVRRGRGATLADAYQRFLADLGPAAQAGAA